MKTEKDQIKVLMMFDSPTTMSGFSQVGNNVGKGFVARGAVVDVWGINFQGWQYHKVDWANQIFPGGSPGEWHMPDCLSRFLTVLQNGGYTHVWIMQDLFGFKVGEGGSNFAEEIFRICSSRGIRSCFYFPCDAPLDRDWVAVLGSVDAAVAYTEYGAMHARKQLARLESDQVVHVLPHGVDPVIYAPPADRATLRANLYRPAWFGPEDFVMINVNQHQRRKDVMRSLEILAELKNRGVPAKLIMHMANTSGELVTLTEWVPLRRGGREGVGEQLGLRYGKDWGHNDAVIPPQGGAAGAKRAGQVLRGGGLVSVHLAGGRLGIAGDGSAGHGDAHCAALPHGVRGNHEPTVSLWHGGPVCVVAGGKGRHGVAGG